METITGIGTGSIDAIRTPVWEPEISLYWWHDPVQVPSVFH